MTTSKLPTLALLGLGAMGRRMAARLVRAGHPVVAWSRSGVPDDLVALGARAAASPADAAADAQIVISMVTNDRASEAVWCDRERGALARLLPGSIAIESSTVTPAWIERLDPQVRHRGGVLVDAPVVGSRPQAEAGTLIHLVGGAPEVVDRVRPVLGALGNTIHHVGPSGAGALVKLVVNALFAAQVAAVAELLPVVRRSSANLATVIDALGALPVTSPAAKGALAAIVAERFEPLFPIDLVEKDLRCAIETAGAFEASVPLIERVAERFALARERGHGGENVTAIARLHG